MIYHIQMSVIQELRYTNIHRRHNKQFKNKQHMTQTPYVVSGTSSIKKTNLWVYSLNCILQHLQN